MTNGDGMQEKRFWLFVEEIGLAPSDVYTVIDKDVLADCTMSKQELFEKLKERAAAKAAHPEHQEPGEFYPLAIVWGNIFNPDGVEVSWTARHGATRGAILETLLEWQAAWGEAKRLGFTVTKTRPTKPTAKAAPASAAKAAKTEPKPAAKVAEKEPEPAVKAEGAADPKARPSGKPGKNDIALVEGVQMFKRGKTVYYRAYGPDKHRRNGVVVWPEVLQTLTAWGVDIAGIELGSRFSTEHLGIAARVSMKGNQANKVTAFFEVKEG